MAPSIGNHVSATAAAATSVTSTAIAIVAGSDIGVWVANYAGSGSNEDVGVGDSVVGDDTYTKSGGLLPAATDGNRHGSLWYYKNHPGGASVTFKYKISNANYPRIWVLEGKGTHITAPLDATHGSVYGAGATNRTTTSQTTVVADEILIAGSWDDQAPTSETFTDGGCAANSGTWTKIEAISDFSTLEGALGYAIVSATGSYCVKSTAEVSCKMQVSMMSFKIAAAATGSLPPPLRVLQAVKRAASY